MGYLLRLNPSGNQFSIAHGVDVDALADEIAEAISERGSFRVRYELSDLPDVTGELFVNTAALDAVELTEIPDMQRPPTRGLGATPSHWDGPKPVELEDVTRELSWLLAFGENLDAACDEFGMEFDALWASIASLTAAADELPLREVQVRMNPYRWVALGMLAGARAVGSASIDLRGRLSSLLCLLALSATDGPPGLARSCERVGLNAQDARDAFTAVIETAGGASAEVSRDIANCVLLGVVAGVRMGTSRQ